MISTILLILLVIICIFIFTQLDNWTDILVAIGMIIASIIFYTLKAS